MMNVLGIEQITKKDVPLYYRNDYEGLANLEFHHKHEQVRIAFSVEIKATGHREVKVRLLDAVDYPLMSVIRHLKHAIADMEKAGRLG